jgi:hypothetical protein
VFIVPGYIWLNFIQIPPFLEKKSHQTTVMSPKIPSTARSIETFAQIRVGMSMSMKQVIAICGLPDADIGSGIYIYVYNLADGSQVLISAANKNNIIAINHSLKQFKGLAGTGRRLTADDF